jgi:RNA polymerase sigma-70 factor, ECF subfamily
LTDESLQLVRDADRTTDRASLPGAGMRTLQMKQDPTVLLDQARAGNEVATGRLLESYETYLTLLARVQIGRRLQGKADAGDLVQETFLEVHRQMRNFRGNTEAELLAWLRRILAGQIALMLRRYLGTKGRDVKLERELAVQLDQSSQALGGGLAATYSTPSQHASRREQAAILADALEQLSSDYREVIVLRHLEGLSFPDVAGRMGRSEDSVQKLWVRALAKLRNALGGVA